MKDNESKLELELEGQYDETIAEHVQYPLYINNYEDALRVIFLSVLRKGYQKEELEEEGANIIPFLGKRGSGKTTAMKEFGEILNNLAKPSECEWWINHVVSESDFQNTLKEKGFFFHVIRLIDASMLSNKEDIFELIMSEIYTLYMEERQNSCFQRKENNELHRKIVKDFENILQGYYAIRDSREDEFMESYIEKLAYVSRSFNLHERIGELVEEIFRNFLKCDREYFIVIVLDDLDLNIDHGYEILRQLQKYFSDRHFLITFSADYDQLNHICWCHYIQEFSREKSHVIEELVQERCLTLAKDYIEKVLPLNNRIYMLNANDKTHKVLVVRHADKRKVTVKQYLMENIAACMHIYYDICGVKEHFIEPKTIRNLVSFDLLLKSFQYIPYELWEENKISEEESRHYMEEYDQNHERFNGDIANRMANSFLQPKQRKEFADWLSIDLERRVESACVYMEERIPKTEKPNMEKVPSMEQFIDQNQNGFYDRKDFASEKKAQHDQDSTYSYGALLENIYHYGRISAENKAYVKCLLASLTSEMVREKISFRLNPDERGKEKSKQRLYCFMGNTFGNSWLGEMIPGKYSYPHNINLGFQKRLLGKSKAKDLVNIPRNGTSNEIVLNLLRNMKSKNIIQSLEWLLCFLSIPGKFTDINEFPFQFIIADSQHTVKGKTSLHIEFNASSMICAGIWEFIPKTLELEQYVSFIHKGIAQELCNAVYLKYNIERADKKKKIEDLVTAEIEKESMFIPYLQNCSDAGRPVFPFYQLDLAYNVFKRTRCKLKKENPAGCNMEEVFSYITKAYEMLIKNMKEEDEKYNKIGIDIKYADRLKNFPFIKIFLEKESFEKINSEIKELLLNILWIDDTNTYINDLKGGK